MSFPLNALQRTWAAPPDLAQSAHTDALAGGGTVVEGQGPSTWVGALHDQELLTRELAVGLCAALFQADEPGPVAEAARLAEHLGGRELADLLRLGWQGLDVGLLLAEDPFRPGRSVEDALVHALAATADLTDDAARADVLSAARNAGHPTVELRVLLAHSTEAEVLHWLPAVLQEPNDDESEMIVALQDCLSASEPREEVVQALLHLPLQRREQLMRGITDPLVLARVFESPARSVPEQD